METDKGNFQNEIWTMNKRWNWSSYTKLALSVSRTWYFSWLECLNRIQWSWADKISGHLSTATSKNYSVLNSIYVAYYMMHIYIYIYIYNQYSIQQFFFGVLISVARRKTVVQLGTSWGAVSPPQWDPGEKPRKMFGYFAFWIA